MCFSLQSVSSYWIFHGILKNFWTKCLISKKSKIMNASWVSVHGKSQLHFCDGCIQAQKNIEILAQLRYCEIKKITIILNYILSQKGFFHFQIIWNWRYILLVHVDLQCNTTQSEYFTNVFFFCIFALGGGWNRCEMVMGVMRT